MTRPMVAVAGVVLLVGLLVVGGYSLTLAHGAADEAAPGEGAGPAMQGRMGFMHSNADMAAMQARMSAMHDDEDVVAMHTEMSDMDADEMEAYCHGNEQPEPSE